MHLLKCMYINLVSFLDICIYNFNRIHLFSDNSGYVKFFFITAKHHN